MRRCAAGVHVSCDETSDILAHIDFLDSSAVSTITLRPATSMISESKKTTVAECRATNDNCRWPSSARTRL